MSKPGADPTSGISLGDALRLPKRHPACRRREAQPGSCMERENLDGDAKGKSASGSNREAEESGDRHEREVLTRAVRRAWPLRAENRGQYSGCFATVLPEMRLRSDLCFPAKKRAPHCVD